MESWEKELADAILDAIAQMGITYDKAPMFRICVALFDLAYPSDVLREYLPQDLANKVIRAKINARHEAGGFVGKSFVDWASMILLLLLIIGKREGEKRMLEDVPKNDSAPTPKFYHNIRSYKKWGHFFIDKLIDDLQLSKNKGGRKVDRAKTKALDAAFFDLLRSEVEVSQEGIESYLKRKIGEQVKLDTVRKRLNRKGKTLSEAKGAKRKSRKKT